MEYHERPGVYSNYELSSVLVSGSGSQTVALAAVLEGEGLMTISSVAQAEKLLGMEKVALNLVRLLLMNGAGTVLVYPAEDSAEGYIAAAEALLAEKSAALIICDSDAAEIQIALKEAILAAAEEGNECIGILGMASEDVSALTERAGELNSERMVLVSGTGRLSWEESVEGSIYGAAAVAGMVAGETDPAVPVHGVALKGLTAISQRFSETEIDSLVRGGVSQLEAIGGTVSLIRAVTSRTSTDGADDASWRELTTIRIVDDVIPGVRNALKARFLRKKNNETTRGAIRSQVVVALEEKKKREIIEDYGEISVEADGEDPTICLVGFSFTVAHGVSRIYLTAHITV